jgi:hypothetical protein
MMPSTEARPASTVIVAMMTPASAAAVGTEN